MIRSEKAVSEVLGMVMVLSIMMIVIGSIMIVGVPAIESAKSRAKMDVAMNSFLSLQNDIEEVVRGPIWVSEPTSTDVQKLGPSRVTEFELMGGTLSVISMPDSTKVSYDASNFTVIIPSSSIEYTAELERIVYENGAVIRKYEAGEPLMVSDPLINIHYDKATDNTSISIHAVSINRTLSSTGGDGKAWAETRLENYSQIPPDGTLLRLNRTNITIYTKYPEVWKAFFDKKLNETARLPRSSEGSPRGYYIRDTVPGELEVQIYGNNTNRNIPDILLSVYESRLDVKVR